MGCHESFSGSTESQNCFCADEAGMLDSTADGNFKAAVADTNESSWKDGDYCTNGNDNGDDGNYCNKSGFEITLCLK